MNFDERERGTLEAVKSRMQSKSFEGTRDTIVGIQAAVMVTEYVRRYFVEDVQQYETEQVEFEVLTPIVNPKTGARSRTFRGHVSKIDALAFDRYSREDVIVEHKSTSEDLAAYSPYWRRLAIDSQVSKYVLSMRQAGRGDLRSILYDVVKKPTTKPKRVIAKLVRTTAETGEYFGFPVPAAELETLRDAYEAGKGAKGGFSGQYDESLILYGLRLRRIVLDDLAGFYQRQTVTRTDADVLEYARELWQLGKEIRESRAADVAPKNTSHCNSYGRLCEYFSLCTGEASADDDRFKSVDWVHSEIDSADIVSVSRTAGRDILTNSRLTMFQSCRRREFNRYEQGLRTESDGDSVSLQWGSLFHDLLEVVWGLYDQKGSTLCQIG
jgi:hypothetical protein